MTIEPTRPFYQVYPDHTRFPDQWFLSDPQTVDGKEIDARDFTEGRPYGGPPPALVPVYQEGKEVAFALSSFDMPVVSALAADVIERVAPGEAEFFPIEIAGAQGKYRVLNAVCRAECLDEAWSEFTMWTEADDNPEMIGNYRMISTIRIDPARAEGRHIFRIARWTLALLVSDELKTALEEIPDLGVVFESVV